MRFRNLEVRICSSYCFMDFVLGSGGTGWGKIRAEISCETLTTKVEQTLQY